MFDNVKEFVKEGPTYMAETFGKEMMGAASICAAVFVAPVLPITGTLLSTLYIRSFIEAKKMES